MKLTDKEAKTEQLLEEYRDLVKAKAHLYYMLGGDIEDIIQEGMIGLYKAIQSYDETKGASFKTFADICVNRQIITAIKTANRRKNVPLNTSVSFDRPVSDEPDALTLGETLAAGSDTDPETLALLEEISGLLLEKDSKFFSPLEYSVFSLMLEGKDYRTIAGELGKTPKSIDNAIQRIRLKLRQFFED